MPSFFLEVPPSFFSLAAQATNSDKVTGKKMNRVKRGFAKVFSGNS